MILCLGPTPALQRIMCFRQWQPNAVNRAVRTEDGIAGKAVNVAKVLHALGETPLLTGLVGGDAGQRLIAEIERRGLAQEWVHVPAPTRQCITVLDQATGSVTELVEESRPVPEEAYARLLAVVERHLSRCRALILSGTLTPGAPPDFYARCVALARQRGVWTVVDSQRDPLRAALAARPTVIKPNRHELEALLEQLLPEEAAVVRAMQTLHAQGAEVVLVSAGSAPLLLFDGSQFWQVIPPALQAVNPIGSGDALTAALVARRLRGDAWPEACRWGVAAGAANALTLMPGELDPQEVPRLHAQVRLQPWPAPLSS